MGADHYSYVVAGCIIAPWTKAKAFDWEVNDKDRDGNDLCHYQGTNFYPNQSAAKINGKFRDIWKVVKCPGFEEAGKVDKLFGFDIINTEPEWWLPSFVIGVKLSNSHHESGLAPVDISPFKYYTLLGCNLYEKLETDLRYLLTPLGLWDEKKFDVWNFIVSSY